MNAADIKPGYVLKLKTARANAYGIVTPMVLVTGIKPRPGYKVPWIESDGRYFTPSDFSRRAG